jgi:hypothetical protein
MLATLTGMRIVMMRKWNPDEGSILGLIVLLVSHTLLPCRCKVCPQQPPFWLVPFLFLPRLIKNENIAIAGG